MTTPQHNFSAQQCATLDALSGILTPGGNGFPIPTEADPTGAVLAMALAHAYPHAETLAAIADQAAGKEPADYLRALAGSDPEGYATLRTVLVGRYLTCRPVWKLLGYSGRRPNPPAADEADYYLREHILDPVIARGPIYVRTPDRTEPTTDAHQATDRRTSSWETQ